MRRKIKKGKRKKKNEKETLKLVAAKLLSQTPDDFCSLCAAPADDRVGVLRATPREPKCWGVSFQKYMLGIRFLFALQISCKRILQQELLVWYIYATHIKYTPHCALLPYANDSRKSLS